MRIKYFYDGVSGSHVPMGIDADGKLHQLPLVMIHSANSLLALERIKAARSKAIFTQSQVARASLTWGSLELLVEELTVTLDLLEARK